MSRPTPYRPRVPDDLFAELNKFSDGTFKGLHELTLRYICEGIEKDRAVQAGKDRKVPANKNFPFRDITILNWAEYYGFEVPKVIEAYAAMADVKAETVNVAFHLDGMDICALNEIFFGENWERDIALRELASQEDKAVKARMKALYVSQEQSAIEPGVEITVACLASSLNVRAVEIIKFMFKRGTPATMHQVLSAEEVEAATNAMQAVPKLAKRTKK